MGILIPYLTHSFLEVNLKMSQNYFKDTINFGALVFILFLLTKLFLGIIFPEDSALSEVTSIPRNTTPNLVEVQKLEQAKKIRPPLDEALLYKGADVNAKAHFSRRKALMVAAQEGHVGKVQVLVDAGF